MYRVVLADDAPDFLAWLRALLEQSGEFLVVGEAGDGRRALELIEALHPDAVLADVDMPELDGLDLARAVHRCWPVVRVLLFSGHSERTYARLARTEGALAFIPKPSLSLAALRHAFAAAK